MLTLKIRTLPSETAQKPFLSAEVGLARRKKPQISKRLNFIRQAIVILSPGKCVPRCEVIPDRCVLERLVPTCFARPEAFKNSSREKAQTS
jgi:hypothetical protein